MRYSEIVDTLWEDSTNRDLSREKPSFKVLVYKRLKRLKTQGNVDKERKSHKNVSYLLTKQGQDYIRRIYLEELIFSMPPIEVQALQFLMFVFIEYVHIITPYGSSLEDYIEALRDKLNGGDIKKLVRVVIEDPKKLYIQLSKYRQKYKAEESISISL